MPVNASFQVVGMTCGHCVGRVTAVLEAVPGVEWVTVDLPTGRVSVDSAAAVDRAALEAAVSTAGYALAATGA